MTPEINEWILTDDSCWQYVKKVDTDSYAYSLIECRQSQRKENEYVVCAETIDMLEYYSKRHNELDSIVRQFGYYGVMQVVEDCGWNRELTDQILAECIFENNGCNFYDAVFVGDEDACCAYIEKYCKEH